LVNNNPEEQSSQLRIDGSLKSHTTCPFLETEQANRLSVTFILLKIMTMTMMMMIMIVIVMGGGGGGDDDMKL